MCLIIFLPFELKVFCNKCVLTTNNQDDYSKQLFSIACGNLSGCLASPSSLSLPCVVLGDLNCHLLMVDSNPFVRNVSVSEFFEDDQTVKQKLILNIFIPHFNFKH